MIATRGLPCATYGLLVAHTIPSVPEQFSTVWFRKKHLQLWRGRGSIERVTKASRDAALSAFEAQG